MSKRNTAVLISGNGTNLQALIDAAKVPDYPARIALVISNKAEAYGVQRAKAAGIPSVVIDHTAYPSREDFDRVMHAKLQEYDIEIVCLAGFMRLLSPWFVQQWEGRMLNIHPSLLPAFKGAHAVRDALRDPQAINVEGTGCTVHLVTEELDAGPPLMRARVPILPGDTEQTLYQRIHKEEHKIYPEALKELALRLQKG